MYSHDAGGITTRDLTLAQRISEIAAEMGATADPGAVSVFELALDTPDAERIGPFWLAVLGYDRPAGDGQLHDGAGQSPTMWFQQTDEGEPRQHFHVDVYVPVEEREARVAAVVAAGGTVVAEYPEWTVLADADGNKACICV
jgi:4a-hydroxytetrahydrobiopterin dehydratase